MSKYQGKTKARLRNTYTTRYFEGVIVLDEKTGKKRARVTNTKYYDYEIDKFKVGDEVLLNVTSKKKKRTENQNRYLHVYFSLIALSSGHTEKEIKAWAKGKFLSKGITEVFGQQTRIVNDTSDLTVLEMIEFIARVEAHTGIPAPNPEPFNLAITWDEYERLRDKEIEIYKKLTAKL